MADSVSCIRPKLIVFDLDYTLWPFWVDTHVYGPFKRNGDGTVTDGMGEEVKYFNEVPDVLEKLNNDGYMLGIASRTETPDRANELLKAFDWNKYFKYKEIYPGRKTTHFKRFKEQSKLDYSEMLFLDDEQRNIIDLKKIGVTSFLVNDGVNKTVMEKAFKMFEKDHS